MRRTRGLNFSWIGAMNYRAALLFAAFCLLPGCNNAGSTPLRSQDSTVQAGGRNACALLSDDEIRGAIGAHSPGRPNVSEMTRQSVMRNMWGFQSCRWTAKTAQPMQGFPNGWFDKIELKVFDHDRVSWARKQANGEAVKGLGEGAVYDASYGRLWFNCGRGQFCMLNADTANGSTREQLARHLATLVQDRLK
jgi:hypothetical protein